MNVAAESAPRTTAAALARIGAGLCVLGCAAAIIATTGVGGLGGALGSLFGFGHHTASPAASAAGPGAASPDAAGRPAVVPLEARMHPPARTRHGRHHRARRAPGPPAGSPPPASPPNNLPGPPAPPPRPPSPSAGAVQKTVETVQQTEKSLPPQVHPVADPVVTQVVSTVNSSCGLIGGCP